MRKDSEIFLGKILEYRKKTGKDAFKLHISFFNEIPNITSSVNDILRDLINNNCLASQSRVLNLEYNILIYLTLDGISYFDGLKSEGDKSQIVFNVSGGQFNFAKDNGKIGAEVRGNMRETEKNEKEKKNINKTIIQAANDKKIKTVFISYSWTPETNKEWVKKLVQNLEQDGVQVVIDYKDLKLGYDKYAFMERIVTDDVIDKVLIICNRTYKEKADNRSGGVGDESAIITSQMYGNVRQEKFIPVVNEYDEDGKPYLPNYLSSRMYVDLVDFKVGYQQLIGNIIGKSRKEVLQSEEDKIKLERDIDIFNEPTPFFAYRFGKAFPGVRGIKEFDNPNECIDRLEIMLKAPLNKDKQRMTDPIWWFRGGSNLDIGQFKRISSTKFLMDIDEIEVKKVIAYASRQYFRSFVYVEASPEETCGVYGKISEDYINEMIKLYGEYHEEYALYEGNVITRAEYDDGAAVIDGKVVDLEGKAELRVRYLTPYNFIICAKWNPFNQSKNDYIVEDILNGMLKGTNTIDDLVRLCEGLPRHRKDM